MTTNLKYKTIGSITRVGKAISLLGVTALLVLATSSAWAQETTQLEPARSPFLNWLLLLVVFVVIWLIFYMVLYPQLLRYYPPDFSKSLFWSLFLLYGLAWLHLSLYALFDYGFFFPWLRWVAVFLIALWLIWFAVVTMMRRA